MTSTPKIAPVQLLKSENRYIPEGCFCVSRGQWCKKKPSAY